MTETNMNWLKRICVATLLVPTLVFAQAWPTKSIKMIVPFPPGGGVDYLGRLAAKGLGDLLGTQVYVENQAGANGAIGAQALARAAPDGYTIMAISDGPIVASPYMVSKSTYEPLRDFAPIAMLARYPCALVASPSAPLKSISELIALAKAKPDTVTYGSAGSGNFSHLAMEMFQFQTGTKMTHVPYRGTAPATMGLLSGDINLMYTTLATALQHINAGKMRPLGVGEAKRLPALSNIPAIAETVPGYNFSGWVGLFAPANTPPAIVARLSRESSAFLASPETVKVFSQQQLVSFHQDPAQFTQFIGQEQGRWSKLIKERGIKSE